MPKGSKVLMADDDKMLLDMYKERLELAGYVVQSYYNGEDAIAHVHDFVPDIIMLDVMMPKMNGYETLASLKSDPTTKTIPVVMLSALMRDFNREKAVEGGAEDYLIKSEAMPSDVITKIEQVLQKFGKGTTPIPGLNPTPASAQVPASLPSMDAPSAPPMAQAASAAAATGAVVATPAVSVPTPIQAEVVEPKSELDQTKEPIMPDVNSMNKGADTDLGSKLFTTPPSDVQTADVSTTGDLVQPEEKALPKEVSDTLIFEPDNKPLEQNQETLTPPPPPAAEAEEVAKVTEIAPDPVVTNADSPSVPETPLAEDVNIEEVARSNWIIPVIVTLIIILLVVGGITFYYAFLRN